MFKKTALIKKNKFIAMLTVSVIGVALILTTASSELTSIQRNAAEKASAEMKSTLHLIESFFYSELYTQSEQKDCTALLKPANDFVFMFSQVAGIHFIENNNLITCSTILGNRNVPYDGRLLAEKSDNIQLMYSVYTPTNSRMRLGNKSALLLVIKTSPHKSVIFSLYSSVFEKMLPDSPFYRAYLHIGNAVLSKDGLTSLTTIDGYDQIDNSLFSIYYTATTKQYLAFILSQYGLSIIIWLIGSSLLMYLTFDYFIDYFDSKKIKKGIKKHEFVPFLQPVFNINKELIGAEVLVRWISFTKGMISPAEFIDKAEQSGLINDITASLFEQCTTQFNAVSIPQDKEFKLAFNICPIQFESERLFDDCNQLAAALSKQNIGLTFEITERQEFASNELYLSSIARLKQRGVTIALDDFGTGHCSLKYLHQVDINILKIDKSYVDTIVGTSHTKILENIIDLAVSLDVPMVAEGIETTDQFDFLASKGVQYYQGFLLGRPIPVKEFIETYLPADKTPTD